MEVYEIQKLQLSSWDRSALESLLQSQGLRLDGDVETAFGVYETSGEEPTLVGCGCAAGALLKCFALLPQLRGQNLLGRLVSALTQDRFAAGYYDLMVITRAHNETLFVNSGFWTVAKTEQLVLLENQPDVAWMPVKPSRTSPTSPPRRFCSCLRMSCSWWSTFLAKARNCTPSAVGRTPVVVRSKMSTPSSFSTFFRYWLRAGWVIYSLSAALVMLFSSAMTTI